MNKVMSGHEDVGRTGGTTFQEMAQNMGKASGDDSKFAGKSMVLGSVKAMLPEDSSEESDEEQERSGKASGDEEVEY